MAWWGWMALGWIGAVVVVYILLLFYLRDLMK